MATKTFYAEVVQVDQGRQTERRKVLFFRLHMSRESYDVLYSSRMFSADKLQSMCTTNGLFVEFKVAPILGTIYERELYASAEDLGSGDIFFRFKEGPRFMESYSNWAMYLAIFLGLASE